MKQTLKIDHLLIDEAFKQLETGQNKYGDIPIYNMAAPTIKIRKLVGNRNVNHVL